VIRLTGLANQKTMFSSITIFRSSCVAALAALSFASELLAYTKSGTSYATNGSQADVVAAISNASAGDTINIPAGSFTWGAGGTYVSVNKPVTLAGAGQGSTTINISVGGPTWGTGIINLSAAGASVRGFTITQPNTGNTTAFSAGSSNGWRISNITYVSAATAGYFCYAGSYGLIDNCVLNGGNGSDEMIFARGPSDSWQTASTMGTAEALYIEDCVFNVVGYTDFNSNARAVIRYCTINDQYGIKIDAHGLASNTPARSARHTEIYGNRWTNTTGWNAHIEIRGGTGMIFDNVSANTEFDGFFLTDYGYQNQWPNFSGQYQTPSNYPINDQIGVGKDPKAAASEPLYVWNNVRNGKTWARNGKSPAAGAIALYGRTFTESDIIKSNRDVFGEAGFDSSTGVNRGTKAAMLSFTPNTPGYGWWVTDEATWNNGRANSGQLYTWNGSAWQLKYTPYTYPHPLRQNGVATQLLPAPSNTRVQLN
jgi:hypothetical protein